MSRLNATIALLCFSSAILGGPLAWAGEGSLHVIQSVLPAAPGLFQAKVTLPRMGSEIVVPNAKLSLRGQQGAVHRGMTDMRGEVEILDVAPGLYAMTVQADGVFACYAMHVVPRTDPDAPSFPAVAEVSCALVTPQHFGVTVSPYVAANSSREMLQVDDQTLVRNVDASPADDKSVIASDDELTVRLRSATGDPATDMNVFVFKDRKGVARGLTDQQGRLVIADLASGVYSLVAVGQTGVAAVGFELVRSSRRSAAIRGNGYTLVAQTGDEAGDGGTLDVEVIPLDAAELEEIAGDTEEEEDEEDSEPEDEEEVVEEDLAMYDDFGTPLGGGGTGPGAGGGGSGGGGTGGGSGAIAALAIGAAIAAASDSDDTFVPRPTSPNSPIVP